jgi:hypothetical protein
MKIFCWSSSIDRSRANWLAVTLEAGPTGFESRPACLLPENMRDFTQSLQANHEIGQDRLFQTLNYLSFYIIYGS